MTAIRAIRERLSLTQKELAAKLGCSQGNVSNYEGGQTLPPDTAGKLIALAQGRGLDIGYDHVYGAMALPERICGQSEVSHG